ncbi:NADH-quinone oxidoreductase subunit K [Pseudoclavibacter soli]|uniref:NADH-quinone oxidoreductase subunit K n=1 Tax=Pseudoclavibacter soli TaxID=452623 RepID=UPI0003F85901|nr:NADH-quinone oxidoreductase subunit K [Pseudoclavibacter soli]
MSVSLALIIVMAVLYAAGVYAMTERSLSRILIGFLLMGNATNILLLIVSGAPGEAPIVTDGVDNGQMADSLPQALILTAIVITFGISALLLALIYRNWRVARQEHVTEDTAVPGADSHDDDESGQVSAQTHEDDEALHEAIDASDEHEDDEDDDTGRPA